MCNQDPFRVRFEWGPGALATIGPECDVVVIVDVLSFTTSVDIAVARGAMILPFPWLDEKAATYSAAHCAILASRNPLPDQFSLRPSSLVGIEPGTRLVLPSPNGSSLCFHARELGAQIVAGCIRNAATVTAWVNRVGGTVLVVASGERWPDGSLRPCVEDLLGAGAIIAGLNGTCSPEAKTAKEAFVSACPHLQTRLQECVSGQELVERGHRGDVELAARLNESMSVPILVEGAFVDANSRRN